MEYDNTPGPIVMVALVVVVMMVVVTICCVLNCKVGCLFINSVICAVFTIYACWV